MYLLTARSDRFIQWHQGIKDRLAQTYQNAEFFICNKYKTRLNILSIGQYFGSITLQKEIKRKVIMTVKFRII